MKISYYAARVVILAVFFITVVNANVLEVTPVQAIIIS